MEQHEKMQKLSLDERIAVLEAAIKTVKLCKEGKKQKS